MKKLLRKNQIIITALVIMVAVAGYFCLTDKKDFLSVGNTVDSEKAANTEAQVNDGDIEVASKEAKATSGTALSSKDKAGEAVMVGNTVGSSYFESAKLSREQTRTKNKATLLDLVNNKNTTAKQRERATQEIMKMTKISENETATENLLAAKGFENVVVNISEKSVDVIVDASKLTEKQMAQIEDIVKRKTEFSADKIVISTVGKKK